ncbi:hypothetical protein JCM11251_000153 [Rhodosporidiobolus azoricus]
MVCWLEELPSELLEHLLTFFGLPSLLSLSATSRSFHYLISTSYLPTYTLSHYNYDPRTLSHLRFHSGSIPWAPRALWADAVSRRFSNLEFRAAALGGPNRVWKRCLPVVKLWTTSDGRGIVLIARGRGMEVWEADRDGVMRGQAALVDGIDNTRALGRPANTRNDPRRAENSQEDITALADGIASGEVVVARVNGLVQRLRVKRDGHPQYPLELSEVARYSVTPLSAIAKGSSTTVQALSSSGGLLASAATTRYRPGGQDGTATPKGDDPSTIHSLAQTLSQRAAPKAHSVSLHALNSPWESPSAIPFATKPWSVLLSPSSSPSWLAVGHTGTSPLSLIPLTPSGPLPSSMTTLAYTKRTTSVYGLATPSLQSSPFLSPTNTLIAAFYDSTTRVYDLRVPGPPSPSSASAGALVSATSWDDDPSSRPKNEVMRLADPWADDASYSVACGGAHGAYVAVGSARNGAVRLFDVRSPSKVRGITAFSPGRDKSPVYGLAMEGSRLYGVTDQRGFVMDWDAFESPGMERVAYVSHEKREGGGGGELRWTGAERR